MRGRGHPSLLLLYLGLTTCLDTSSSGEQDQGERLGEDFDIYFPDPGTLVSTPSYARAP